MKILLVSHFFPPTHNAGTEKRTLGYALSLQKLRHDVQVVCAEGWEEEAHYWNGYTDEMYQGVPVRRVHINWKLAPDPNRYLYNNPDVEKHLGKWLTEWKPDIVHITSCVTLSASVINAVKDQNIPLVLTLTDFWFICPQLNLLKRDNSMCDGRTTAWDCLECRFGDAVAYKTIDLIPYKELSQRLLRTISKQPAISRIHGFRGMAIDMEDRKSFLTNILERVDCITAPSNSLRDTFIDSGITHPIKVIYSGHDLSWLKDSSLHNKQSPRIRIGFIGQIIPVKGLHVLLSAVGNAQSDKVQLLVYGNDNKDPEYMLKIKDIVKRHPSMDVEFFGRFPHEQLGRVLSTIDVLVVPSQWCENNPRVIQEAFASKTPVIASNVGGISEFVQHEIYGLLFERNNIVELTSHIQRLIDEPELLKKFKSRIPKVKTIAESMLEFEKIYNNLIAGGVKSPGL
jgi:glycosyltransferase involved in cell wall biosynthesis